MSNHVFPTFLQRRTDNFLSEAALLSLMQAPHSDSCRNFNFPIQPHTGAPFTPVKNPNIWSNVLLHSALCRLIFQVLTCQQKSLAISLTNWMSLGWIVTLLVWIPAKLALLRRFTKNSSLAYCKAHNAGTSQVQVILEILHNFSYQSVTKMFKLCTCCEIISKIDFHAIKLCIFQKKTGCLFISFVDFHIYQTLQFGQQE